MNRSATRRFLPWTQRFWQRAQESLRLMVGQHSYADYLAHMKSQHPDREPLDPVAYYRAQEAARFGGDGKSRPNRCC